MTLKQSTHEPRQSTIANRSPGLAYERMRAVRRSHFTQPLARKLGIQGAMLVALAAALSLSVGVGHGSTGGPPGSLTAFAAGGGALVVTGVTAHGAVGGYRLRREPLTEREALALLTVEDVASYLGIATGGLVVAATVVAVLVGLASGAGHATGPTVSAVMVAATMPAGLALAASRFFRDRLPNCG